MDGEAFWLLAVESWLLIVPDAVRLSADFADSRRFFYSALICAICG